MRLADLAYAELPERPPVALLPVGAIEPHGPHAPLGTDTLISVGICDRAAASLEGETPCSCCRTLAYGVTRYGVGVPGRGVDLRDDAARARASTSPLLRAQGFERVVIVNNHFEPEQVAHAACAADGPVRALSTSRAARTPSG